ncbi:DUF3592 domain-containing protein [Actinosynnema sp. CS-041913]|uniref:DUF3592 domain-containing protein n=1 Tax=Actinosynnema sp. CS-041913 TaxID=3239917 RepID=UPI003D8E3430
MRKSIGILAVGLAVVAFGLFLLLPDVGRTGRAEATVVGYGEHTPLRFRTEDGEEVTGTVVVKGSPEVGSKMPVRYDPDEPSDIAVGPDDILVSSGFLVLGAGIVALGLFVGWDTVSERRWRRDHPK